MIDFAKINYDLINLSKYIQVVFDHCLKNIQVLLYFKNIEFLVNKKDKTMIEQLSVLFELLEKYHEIQQVYVWFEVSDESVMEDFSHSKQLSKNVSNVVKKLFNQFYFPLPSLEHREKHIKELLIRIDYTLDDSDIESIAQLWDGLNYREISDMLSTAVLKMYSLQTETKWIIKKVKKDQQTEVNEDNDSVVKSEMNQLKFNLEFVTTVWEEYLKLKDSNQ